MAEEIDIITLVKKTFNVIGSFFRNTGKNFLYFIRFSYRNVKLLAVFLLIGVALGVVFSQLNKIYKSDITFRLNVSNANTFFDLTKSLDNKVVSDQSLAQKLNLPDSTADAIGKIKPHFIIDYFNNKTPDFIDEKDNFVEKDTINVKMRDRLNIEVRTKNIFSFQQIQDGLIYFFSNNEAFKEEKDVHQQQLHQSIDFIEREVKRLEDLSNFEYFNVPKKISLAVDSTGLVVGEKPRQLYYRDITRLLNQKDSLEKVLTYSVDVVSVIKPFAPIKKNENGLIKMSFVFGVSFLILGYILAAFLKYRKQISDFLNEKE